MEVIRISNKLKDLKGEGTEYLVDTNNNVRAKFYNGDIVGIAPQGNTEITKKAA